MGKRFTYWGSGSSAFHPSQLTGGQLYLRKDQATVSSWVSDIGTARDFIQGTAGQQPTITANSLDFDGVNDLMKVTEANAFGADTSGILFFTVYWGGVSNELILTSGDEGGVLGFVSRINSSGKLNLITSPSPGVTDNLISTQTAVIGLNYGYIKNNGSTITMSLNGSSATTATAFSGSNLGDWFADIPSRDNLVLGALVRNTTAYTTCELNKIYYNNTALTSGEIADMNTFMSDPTNF